MKESNKLTTEEYWNKQYFSNNLKKPFLININSDMAASEIDIYFKKYIPFKRELRFIEVGCSPGGWMHYFSKNFGFRVEGIEYTEDGVGLTKRNLKLLNIDSIIHHQDLFDNNLEKEKYDVVFSAGFIEHFTDPSGAIEKHLELLRAGGYLILEVPNLRGFNGFFQRFASKDLLNIHNTKIMNIDFFKNISNKYNLEIVDIAYVGKINFGLFLGKKLLIITGQIIQYLINKIYFLMRKSIFIKDSSWLSPYIVAVYIKR